MKAALVVLCVAAVLFLAALIVLAVVLWRSPTRLAETITRPIEGRLEALTQVVRDSNNNLGDRLADHELRLQRLERERR